MLLIGDIYHLTAGVITFFGLEADHSRDALELLEKAGSMVEVDFSLQAFDAV